MKKRMPLWTRLSAERRREKMRFCRVLPAEWRHKKIWFCTMLIACLMLVSCANTPVPEETPPAASPSASAQVTPDTVETSAPPPAAPVEEIKLELEGLWGRIDGSTATIPLTEALYEALNGGGDWPPVHNTTSVAYTNLIQNASDLVFVTYPSDYEFKMTEKLVWDFEITPVTKDALVFLVNIDNPVDGITLSQLRDIYAGKITNWKQLGGLDEEIIPYQRTESSGSQTLFIKLLMGDTVPMTPPTELIAASMGGLVEAVSGYDNARNAIGYSMFYYVNNMYGNSRFKLLSIDGVKPGRDTITRGAYALEDAYYAVIRSDTPADSPARKLIDWVLTDDGQRLAVKAGYIPLRPLENAEPDNDIDPIYLGDTDNSSGTGGTVLLHGDGAPEIGTENVRPPLSDMFFDGFNYIRHINSEIMAQLNRIDNEFFDYTWGEQVQIRPFTGIPKDYPNYELPQYGYLRIDFPEGNPFFRGSAGFHIPLTADISPYGLEPEDYSVTYDYAGELLPKVKLYTLNVSIPDSPGVAARINGRLRAWENGFAGDVGAKETLTEFIAWYTEDWPDNQDSAYPLQPVAGRWGDYLSVCYVLQTYDGPSFHMPMVYSICFDVNTGDEVEFSKILTKKLDYSSASVFTPMRFTGESPHQDYLPEGYIPADGAVITDAWVIYENLNLTITEPDGRVLQVMFWDDLASITE